MIRRLQLTSVVLAFASLLLPADAPAQVSNLRGQVVDVEGNPLRDVIVKLEPAAGGREYELKTDKKGRFRRLDVRAGLYRIIYSKDGYSTVTDQLQIGLGSNQVPQVELVEAKSGVAGLTVLELEGVRERKVIPGARKVRGRQAHKRLKPSKDETAIFDKLAYAIHIQRGKRIFLQDPFLDIIWKEFTGIIP